MLGHEIDIAILPVLFIYASIVHVLVIVPDVPVEVPDEYLSITTVQ